MADLARGYQFSGNPPNNQVTAEKLNNLVDLGRILPGFYTDKAETDALQDGDYLLIYRPGDGLYYKAQKINSITSAVNQTGFRNLVAKNNAATPATKIDVTADEIILRSDTGGSFRATSISETLDISTYAGGSTINGRDYTPLIPAGPLAIFGGIWAVSNGGLTKLLWSQSNTPAGAPALPTGYQYKALLGVVYMNASGVLINFSQRGNEVAITTASNAGTSANTLNPTIAGTEFTDLAVNATAGTWTAVSLAFCVPKISTRVRGTIGSTLNATVLTSAIGYGIAESAAGTMAVSTSAIGAIFGVVTNLASANAEFGFKAAIPFDVPVNSIGTIPTIYAACTNNSTNHNMRISGYSLNL